jgi:aspartate/methionine/tyrosine aminotransferase
VERNLGIITANLTLLDDFFDRHADTFAWQRPKAGPIAFPRLQDGDSEAFCERLVREAGVLLLPGTVFDDPGNHVRIGFGRRDTSEALARLEAYLHR